MFYYYLYVDYQLFIYYHLFYNYSSVRYMTRFLLTYMA